MMLANAGNLLSPKGALAKPDQPIGAVTGSVADALRLGCSAIGYTIYPGSSERNRMYEDLRDLIAEAKSAGLPTVVWAYPRGRGISKEGETAVDVCAYAAQISARLGAHVITIKPPRDFVEQPEAKAVLERYRVSTVTLAERARHCVQSAFNGKRIVIFSGGEIRDSAGLLSDIGELAAGGAFGAIVGRNAFQRPRAEALSMLAEIQRIFRDAT